MTLHLRCGEISLNSEIQNRDTVVSRSTGAELKRLTITIRTTDQDAGTLEHVLSGPDPLEMIGADGQALERWQARSLSHSFSNNSPVHTHVWELLQQEVLSIKSLQLDDLEIVPYEYKETFDEKDRITIDARSRLDPDQLLRFNALPTYFSVVRKGISDSPKEMRLGRCLWSDHGEYVKQQIYLVDRAQDAERQSALFQPEFNHSIVAISEQTALLAALLEMLKAKGILDDDSIAEVRNGASEAMGKYALDFMKVADLDGWK